MSDPSVNQVLFADIAPIYWAHRLPVIPLMFQDKRPIVHDWSRFAEIFPTEEEQEDWLSRYKDNNIGVVLGPQSGLTMIDIDTDASELIAAIVALLPSSPWHRKGRKGMMLAYKFSGIQTFRIKEASGKMLVECLSSKTQIVLPPSIHPDTKQPYEADCDLYDVLDQLVELPGDIEGQLRKLFTERGIALTSAGSSRSLDHTVPIGAGGRDEGLTGIAGTISAMVMRGERTLAEGIEMMLLQETRLEQPEGDPIPPGEGVAKLLRFFMKDVRQRGRLPNGWAEGLVDDLRAQIEAEGAGRLAYLEALGDLQANYYLLTHSMRTTVLSVIDGEEGGTDIVKHGKDQLRDLYARAVYENADGKHHPVDSWMRSDKRKDVDGVAFYPGEGGSDRYLNPWRGWHVAPKEGDCSTILHHLHEVVADGHDEYYWWLLRWMAHLVQHPEEKPGVALVLKGEKGTGKSVVADMLGRFCPSNYVKDANSDRILGKFNGIFQTALVYSFEEAFWSGDKKAEEHIKHIISDEKMTYERKGMDAIKGRNFTRFVICSNRDWVVPATPDDRRWFVLQVSRKYQQDAAYFSKLWAALDGDEIAAFMDHLLKVDLSGFNVHKPPRTPWLMEQAIQSLDPYDGWLLDLLQTGEINRKVAGFPSPIRLLEDEVTVVSKSDVREAFQASRQGRSIRSTSIDNTLPKYLHKLGVASDREGPREGRKRVYRFPPLRTMRAKWETLYGLMDWDEPTAEVIQLPSLPPALLDLARRRFLTVSIN